MEELVEYLAKSLVEHPNKVRVIRKDMRRSLVLKLEVAPDDTGRVIGKQGRVASAMRVLLQVAARNEPKSVVLEQKNHHVTKNVYIGETKADGQFKILKSYKGVVGEPFLKGTFKAKPAVTKK